jgi:hypothetical protein
MPAARSYDLAVRATPAIGIALVIASAGTLASAGVLAGGCGSREAPRRPPGEAPATPARALGAPDAPASPGEALAIAAPIAHELAPVPPVVAPHGAPVAAVVVADGGGAALSLDASDEVRLWPALDGTREPIVVRVAAARQLALARVGGELVAAIADAAGGGQVLRFDAAGALAGRVTLPVEPPIQSLAIAGGVVLARRADQTLAAYGVRGDVRGGLTAPPGQRIVAIVARGGAAAVALSGEPGPAVRVLQKLALGPRISWSARIELPEELAQLALAPGGDAIAGLAYGQIGRIIELEPRPRLTASIAPGATLSADDLATIGFVDRQRAVLTSTRIHMEAYRAGGAWTVQEIARSPGLHQSSPAAIGDGAAVAGQNAGLAILGANAKYLGYRDPPAGRLHAPPLVLQPVSGSRLLWLDDQLRAVRVGDGAGNPSLAVPGRGRAIDDRRFATAHPLAVPGDRWRIVIRDLAAGTEQEIASGEELFSIEYDPGTRVLAARGRTQVLRYRLPPGAPGAPGAPVPLRGIAGREPLRRVYLTDPALAGGVVAMVTVSDNQAQAYLAPQPDLASAGALQPGAKVHVRGGWILSVDRAGRLYAAEDNAVVIYRDGKPVGRLPVVVPHVIAVSDDGSRIAVLRDREVIVFDAGEAERWRAPIPLGVDAAWSGGQLVVSTHAGTIALDAATGRRTAVACGWTFGLHDPKWAPTAVAISSECAN